MKTLKTRMIIVAAPSGAGKSSFVERICKEEPRLEDTITFTTRAMRAGESQGHPYHFVSLSEFKSLIDKNYFVEYAQVHNNFYGTPLEQLEKAWAANRCIIMDVDVQGAATFRAKYPDAKSVFILPPSIDELRRRVIKRDGKVPEDLEIRMMNAEREMTFVGDFDFKLINDDFQRSYMEFKKIVEELLR